MTELHKITLGIGLMRPLTLTLRDPSHTIVKLTALQNEDWERKTLESSLACSLSPWLPFENQHEDTQVSIKACGTDGARSYYFICSIS
jgi:hypothetical protein